MHVVSNIFTVDKGITKVLLIKRTNKPYKDYWALPGGAMYNNELVLDSAKRELNEKTGIKEINLSMHKIIDTIDRSPLKRMIAISFIGVMDIEKAEILSKTNKTSDIGWFDIKNIPELAYDHNEIVNYALEELRK